jgi:hypothetical protein
MGKVRVTYQESFRDKSSSTAIILEREYIYEGEIYGKMAEVGFTLL